MLTKKLVLCSLFLISLLSLVNGEGIRRTDIPFLDKPNNQFEFSAFDYKINVQDYKKKRIFAIEEYIKRPQFQYLMTGKAEKEYSRKLEGLLQDVNFLNIFNIKRNETGWFSKGMREKAVFNMGQYYFNNWTKFKIGKPRLNLGRSIVDTFYNLFIGNVPLISIPFRTPYRTVYNAEQSYRFYLKRYQNGRYAVPALFSIALCRIHQKDYLEATIAYKYALRFLMEQNGFTNSSIANSYAQKLTHYAKEYERNLCINLQVSRKGSTNYIDSRFEFSRENKSVYIGITFGSDFGSSTTNANK